MQQRRIAWKIPSWDKTKSGMIWQQNARERIESQAFQRVRINGHDNDPNYCTWELRWHNIMQECVYRCLVRLRAEPAMFKVELLSGRADTWLLLFLWASRFASKNDPGAGDDLHRLRCCMPVCNSYGSCDNDALVLYWYAHSERDHCIRPLHHGSHGT